VTVCKLAKKEKTRRKRKGDVLVRESNPKGNTISSEGAWGECRK